ncbi:methyltransferase domain-containing protein [Pseudodesulfovibrio sp. F-1]|uniref:Methyltransferase domain-containing protein n=1 Tax=Pseudodesulfovibrio alkaliphilus TaxID=2661613 RepID=A0A7K1KM72_9BACT|nr:class I SAM-dependent methyltransferase [Pseudodesulfovibrio alkaliphilus]MUM77107.1 methyltransferase domain-containing protein [Pseudodesulfovibrio alkaliphilus]
MQDQRRYWTERGRDKTFTTPFRMDVFQEHVDRDARVLDFGCGYGRTLAELAAAGYTGLTGIDFSEPLIERGRAEHPGLDLVAYPGGPLPFGDNVFDAAMMLGVFTCIVETRAQAEALLELKRVLRPGGLLYVNDFLLNRDRRNLDRYKIGHEKYGIYGIFDVDDGGIMRHHDRNHMEALFLDFETVVFEETVFETMHGHLSNGFWALLRLPA